MTEGQYLSLSLSFIISQSLQTKTHQFHEANKTLFIFSNTPVCTSPTCFINVSHCSLAHINRHRFLARCSNAALRRQKSTPHHNTSTSLNNHPLLTGPALHNRRGVSRATELRVITLAAATDPRKRPPHCSTQTQNDF